MITTWLASIVGQRFARPVLFGLIGALLVIVAVTAFQCSRAGDKRAVAVQAEQTTKSGEAIAAAAENAVETVNTRASVEAQVDAATITAQKDIDHAETSDDVRAAVLRAVCERVRASGRTDPACVVR